jgi:hypothetical protein
MPRIRIAYVAALWSAITLGAVAHVIAEDEPPGRAASVSAAAPVTLVGAGHREDALGNRYRMWTDR